MYFGIQVYQFALLISYVFGELQALGLLTFIAFQIFFFWIVETWHLFHPSLDLVQFSSSFRFSTYFASDLLEIKPGLPNGLYV